MREVEQKYLKRAEYAKPNVDNAAYIVELKASPIRIDGRRPSNLWGCESDHECLMDRGQDRDASMSRSHWKQRYHTIT